MFKQCGDKVCEFFYGNPLSVDGNSLVGRTALARRAVHIEDCLADPNYKQREAARIGKHRTMLGVPLLRDGVAIGVIGLLRTVVKPFTERQIELVTAFADQAVIAIENARLLNELRQRTTDLTEALEQQTATSQVLQVISSSLGDLEPIFGAMLANAVRISGATFGIIHSWDGEYLRLLATHNLPPALERARKGAPAFKPGPKTGIRRMVATKKVVQVPDLREDEGYPKNLRHRSLLP